MAFTMVYKKVTEGYIGFIEELPGANSQAKNLNELKDNLKEAVQLVMEANKVMSEEMISGQKFSHEQFKIATLWKEMTWLNISKRMVVNFWEKVKSIQFILTGKNWKVRQFPDPVNDFLAMKICKDLEMPSPK